MVSRGGHHRNYTHVINAGRNQGRTVILTWRLEQVESNALLWVCSGDGVRLSQPPRWLMTPANPLAMARTHPLEHLEAILVVGIGGFAGSNLRYFVELFVPSSLVATATVNVLGCLALGFLTYEGLFSGRISRASRMLMGTGFIASFTTYSTFIVDALTTTPKLAIGYIIGSYLLGFGGVLVGREAVRWITTVAPLTAEASE